MEDTSIIGVYNNLVYVTMKSELTLDNVIDRMREVGLYSTDSRFKLDSVLNNRSLSQIEKTAEIMQVCEVNSPCLCVGHKIYVIDNNACVNIINDLDYLMAVDPEGKILIKLNNRRKYIEVQEYVNSGLTNEYSRPMWLIRRAIEDNGTTSRRLREILRRAKNGDKLESLMVNTNNSYSIHKIFERKDTKNIKINLVNPESGTRGPEFKQLIKSGLVSELSESIRSTETKTTSFCKIGIPFLYINHTVYIADENLCIWRMNDLDYVIERSPNAVLYTENSRDKVEKHTQIRIAEYIKQGLTEEYRQIRWLVEEVYVGGRIRNKALINFISEVPDGCNLNDALSKINSSFTNSDVNTQLKLNDRFFIKYKSIKNGYRLEFRLIKAYKQMYKTSFYSLAEALKNEMTKKTLAIHCKRICIANSGLNLHDSVIDNISFETDIEVNEQKQEVYIDMHIVKDYVCSKIIKSSEKYPEIKEGQIIQLDKTYVKQRGVLREVDIMEFIDNNEYSIAVDYGNWKSRVKAELRDRSKDSKIVNIIIKDNRNITSKIDIAAGVEKFIHDGMTDAEFYKTVTEESIRLRLAESRRREEYFNSERYTEMFIDDITNGNTEAYEEMSKFITGIYGVSYSKYEDSDTKFFDTMRVSITFTKYNISYDGVKQLYFKYKKYFETIVRQKINRSDRFKAAGIPLNYFKAEIILKRDHILQFTFSLKVEEMAGEVEIE